MTFLALLTKELRLRLRRERTIWVIIIYILLMGILGWFYISHFGGYNGYNNNNGLSETGVNLYYLLSMVQLFLIMYITPAFTATAVNGEKERQTFDMLLCSRLSSFSLISGKLIAGLVNAILLIAASAPLFSLVFFFGGITPAQILSALLVYVVTTIVVGTASLFCSTLLSRPAVSTAVSYMAVVLWVVLPLLISFILLASSGFISAFLLAAAGSQPMPTNSQTSLLFVWNPVTALISTYPGGGGLATFSIGKLRIAPWLAYTILSLLITGILIILSTWAVKPNPVGRLRSHTRKDPEPKEATATA
jgi:ABC-type transport system involved in multi-copper enzyme maturation permease subunit